MTDLYEYLRMLYSTVGQAHCPYCRSPITYRTALPDGRTLAVPAGRGRSGNPCAPVFKIYGEDYAFLFDDIRTKGYRRVRIDGELCDLSEELELDENEDFHIEAVIDRFVIRGDLQKQLLASIEHGASGGRELSQLPSAKPRNCFRPRGRGLLRRLWLPRAPPQHGRVDPGLLHLQRAALRLRHLFGLGHLSTGPSRSAGARQEPGAFSTGPLCARRLTATRNG